MPRKSGFAFVELAVVIFVISVGALSVATYYFTHRSDKTTDSVSTLAPTQAQPTDKVTPLPTETPAPEATPEPTIEIVPSTSPVYTNPTATSIPTTKPTNIPPTNTPVPATPTPTPEPSCVSNTSPTFTKYITDMSKVNYIAAPPTLGSGPSLKTHAYIGTDHAKVPVYAPVNMTLSSGAYYTGGPYTIEFKASCEVTLRFGHITEPVASIMSLMPASPSTNSGTSELSPVYFKAGDLIAYTTGTSAAGNWDFGVYNSATTNRYASDPDWNSSTVYTTAVCPFKYYYSNLKSTYYALFDPDILAGNPPDGETFCE